MLLKAAYQFEQRHSECLTDLAKFNQVQPTFSRFILRHEGLRLPEAFGQIFLPKSCTQTELPQDLLKDFLFQSKDALLHSFNKIELTRHPKSGYTVEVSSLSVRKTSW
jgi:hypothetical protein